MAVTKNTYTGNGTTTVFQFTFPYIDTSDIKVTLNGTATTAYTFATATTIKFNSAPASGTKISIYRSTQAEDLRATFYPGSAIRALDLNQNFLQALYVVQDSQGSALDANGGTMFGDLNLNNNKITNLAPGVDPGDGITKAQLDAAQTSNNAALASSVSQVQGYASTAQSASISASASASAAAASTAQAQSAATAAATTAVNAAASASSSSSSALSSAQLAASFTGDSMFVGWKRNSVGNLLLTYSLVGESTTYATSDYEYKGGSQWYIGSVDLLNKTGPNIGKPKFSIDSKGHLILSI